MKKLMVSAIFIILITLLFPQLSVYADNADNEPIQGITQTTDEPVYINDRCYPLTANKEEKNDEDGVFYAFKFAADRGGTRNIYAVMDGYILDIQSDYLWLEDNEGEIQTVYSPQISGSIEWLVSPDDDVEAGDVIGRISSQGMDYQNLYVRFLREDIGDDEQPYFTWNEIFNGEADNIGEEISIYDRWRVYTEQFDRDNWNSIIDGFNYIIGVFTGDVDLAADALDWLNGIIDKIIGITSFGFNAIRSALKEERLLKDNSVTMVRNIYFSLYPFVVFISIMIWYIDVYKQIASSNFDGFSKSEFKQLAWSFFGVVFWITNAFGICMLILKMEAGLLSNIIFNDDLVIKPFELAVEETTSGNVFYNFIYTLCAWLSNALTFLALNVIAFIISMCVVCKLTVRQIELCCMVSISSIFFACSQMKKMKWIFKKFFKSYLFVVFQTIPMAIIYKIGEAWVSEEMSKITAVNLDCFIIIIGIGCLMIKKSFIYRILD